MLYTRRSREERRSAMVYEYAAKWSSLYTAPCVQGVCKAAVYRGIFKSPGFEASRPVCVCSARFILRRLCRGVWHVPIGPGPLRVPVSFVGIQASCVARHTRRLYILSLIKNYVDVIWILGGADRTVRSFSDESSIRLMREFNENCDV